MGKVIRLYIECPHCKAQFEIEIRQPEYPSTEITQCKCNGWIEYSYKGGLISVVRRLRSG